jgi:rSAM/selenodomain-associated transferase 1
LQKKQRFDNTSLTWKNGHAVQVAGVADPCGLVFFLKFPRKGNIKTRLAKAIGNTMTLKLYQCFILDLLDKLIPLRDNNKCDIHISLTPANQIPAMHQWLKQYKELHIPIHPQEGHGLGERMKRAFEKMFQMGYESCALMGTDFPDLPASVPLEAVEQLKQKNTQAIIAPTADGGYYLIGFHRSHFCKAVFNSHEIQWSTNQVFPQTMTIFQQEDVQVKQLQQWRDVDDLDDLEDLMKRNLYSEFNDSRTMRLLLEHKKEIFSQWKKKSIRKD